MHTTPTQSTPAALRGKNRSYSTETGSFINYRQTLITPIIGLVSNDFQPKPNVEVALAFRLPLARFLSSRAYWTLAYGETRFVHFFRDDIEQEPITTWG